MTPTPHGPAPALDHPPEPSREERSRRTRDLLLRAEACPTRDEREALLDEVVLLNLRVARAVAACYRDRGVALEDLEQVAVEGLVKAVRRFDGAARRDLLSFAVPTRRSPRSGAWRRPRSTSRSGTTAPTSRSAAERVPGCSASQPRSSRTTGPRRRTASQASGP